MQRYEERAAATSVHQPERIFSQQKMTDVYPLEVFHDYYRIHGPIVMTTHRSNLPDLLTLPQSMLESDARWNIVRLGRAANTEFPTGFEGYVVDEPDPAKTLVDTAKLHIASAFHPMSSSSQWSGSLARSERKILKFISALESNKALTLEELALGNTLMSILVAKLRARESCVREPSQAQKLQIFRKTTQNLVQKARPQVSMSQESDTLSALQWHWAHSPKSVAPDIIMTTNHLSDADQLVLRLLTEIGRFGNPLVRKWLQSRLNQPLR